MVRAVALPLIRHAWLVAGMLAVGLLASCACEAPEGADEAVPATPAANAPWVGIESDSGGELPAEQAAYDVQFYDLALRIEPEARRIDGEVTVRALVVEPMDHLVLDLDSRFEVRSVHAGDQPLELERRDGQLWIKLPESAAAGDELEVTVAYGGVPREAPNPPWEGGFTWATTADDEPWVGVSCQLDGSDLWWPSKDHPSDEPDEGVALHFTVPKPLQAIANGRLEQITEVDEAWHTYHWRVTTPINNYDVTVTVAPYVELSAEHHSIDGKTYPVTWWTLEEDRQQAEEALEQYVDFLAFAEGELGPYPFRADKIGVAQAPYLGMEHQTVIAYGKEGFERVRSGIQFILLHELIHEWWGNLVTANDWRDFWLHESFTSYMEARYVEVRDGEAAYHDYVDHFRPVLSNERPVSPRAPSSIREIRRPLDRSKHETDGDYYAKGALVLHTLRYLVGDDVFLTSLRRFAYPTEALEQVTDGSQNRLVETADFQRLVEKLYGQPLDWFFDVYLHQPELPVLDVAQGDGELRLSWQVPEGLSFPMPIDLEMPDGERRRVGMANGEAAMSWTGSDPVIDPVGWVLRASP